MLGAESESAANAHAAVNPRASSSVFSSVPSGEEAPSGFLNNAGGVAGADVTGLPNGELLGGSRSDIAVSSPLGGSDGAVEAASKGFFASLNPAWGALGALGILGAVGGRAAAAVQAAASSTSVGVTISAAAGQFAGNEKVTVVDSTGKVVGGGVLDSSGVLRTTLSLTAGYTGNLLVSVVSNNQSGGDYKSEATGGGVSLGGGDAALPCVLFW